jgi:hypothetical protein
MGGAGRVALDVGITSPHLQECLQNPSLDPLGAMQRRKVQDCERICHEAGWTYKPLVISAFGRPHVEMRRVIHQLAVAAGRAFGGADVSRTETTWWRNATTLLMERNARMISRCMPRSDLPPIVAGINENAWGIDMQPRNGGPRRNETRAEALVAWGDAAPAPAD